MKRVANFKFISTSPVAFSAIAWVAAVMSLFAQDAVIRGDLVPGTRTSDLLANTLIPMIMVAPVIALLFAAWHIAHKNRIQESILGVLAGAPLMFLTGVAITRNLLLHGVAA